MWLTNEDHGHSDEKGEKVGSSGVLVLSATLREETEHGEEVVGGDGLESYFGLTLSLSLSLFLSLRLSLCLSLCYLHDLRRGNHGS